MAEYFVFISAERSPPDPLVLATAPQRTEDPGLTPLFIRFRRRSPTALTTASGGSCFMGSPPAFLIVSYLLKYVLLYITHMSSVLVNRFVRLHRDQQLRFSSTPAPGNMSLFHLPRFQLGLQFAFSMRAWCTGHPCLSNGAISLFLVDTARENQSRPPPAPWPWWIALR